MANINTKAVAISSNFTRYPGLGSDDTIAETFQINKTSVVPYFSAIADCFSLYELCFTTARVNRQFRSMTFFYIKEQINKTKKLVTIFQTHFESLKKKNSEELVYPEKNEELQKILAEFQNDVLNKCNVYLCVGDVVAYNQYACAVDRLTTTTLLKVTTALKLVVRNNLPENVINFLNAKVICDGELPNQSRRIMIIFAMNLEIQPDLPFSPNLIKWTIKSIELYEFNLVEAVYDKMKRNKEFDDHSYYPFAAYCIRRLNRIHKASNLILQVNNSDDLRKMRYYNEPEKGAKKALLNQQLVANSNVILCIETAESIERVYDLFENRVQLLSRVEDPNHFFGTTEVAVALVKKALDFQDLDFARSVIRYYCINLRDINCDKAIELYGNVYLSEGDIQSAINIFIWYSSMTAVDDTMDMGISLGRAIIKTFLKAQNLEKAFEFVNHERIVRHKRGALQEIIIDYFLEKGMLDESLKLASQIDPLDTNRHNAYVKIFIFLAEKNDLEKMISLISIFPEIGKNPDGCKKIVGTFLDYNRANAAFEFIKTIPFDFTYLDSILLELINFYLKNLDLNAINPILDFIDQSLKKSHFLKITSILPILQYYAKIDSNKFIELFEKYDKDLKKHKIYKELYINCLIHAGEKEKAKAYFSAGIFCWENGPYLEQIDAGIEIRLPDYI